jgi:hypothetical protein
LFLRFDTTCHTHQKDDYVGLTGQDSITVVRAEGTSACNGDRATRCVGVCVVCVREREREGERERERERERASERTV